MESIPALTLYFLAGGLLPCILAKHILSTTTASNVGSSAFSPYQWALYGINTMSGRQIALGEKGGGGRKEKQIPMDAAPN